MDSSSDKPVNEVAAPKFKPAAALAYRDFRLLWIGLICFMGGMQMHVVARGYLTYDITSSPIILGLVNSAFAIPMLTCTLFAGVLADRFQKKRIIQLFQALAAVTAIFVAVSVVTNTVTWVHVFVSSVITGTAMAFIIPSRTAIISSLVSEENASNAFALNAAGMSTTTLLAPAVAGNLYGWLGADGVYFCIAALEFAAVLLMGLIRTSDKTTEKHLRKPVFKEIKVGFQYIGRDKLIVVLIVISLSTALLARPLRSLLPVFIVDIFNRGPETLGLLMSCLGIGAIVGSLFVASVGKRKRGFLLILGGIVSGVSMLISGAVPVIPAMIVALFFVGVGDAFRRSLTMALIMEMTDTEFQGRVSSVYAMNFGLMPLGTLPASVVTEYFGVRIATLSLGIILLGICVVVAVKRRDLRRLN